MRALLRKPQIRPVTFPRQTRTLNTCPRTIPTAALPWNPFDLKDHPRALRPLTSPTDPVDRYGIPAGDAALGRALERAQKYLKEISRPLMVPKPFCYKKNRRDYETVHIDPKKRMEDIIEVSEIVMGRNNAIFADLLKVCIRADAKQHHAPGVLDFFFQPGRAYATVQDYDDCFFEFVEAGQVQAAKGVFRRMVEDGYVGQEYSIEHINGILRRVTLLFSLGTNISTTSDIALSVIDVLPKPYHSTLYSEWMRTALIQTAPKEAAQILDLMFEQGCRPETVHFNLLLRALFRAGEKPLTLKAENLGWHMVAKSSSTTAPEPEAAAFDIQKRHQHECDTPRPTEQTLQATGSVNAIAPTRRVPPANETTFALLMHHHAQTSHWEHVDYLNRKMQELEIKPNSTLMNVLMNGQCLKGDYDRVWAIYKSFTDVPKGSTLGVFPDGESMRILWKTLRLALNDAEYMETSKLPSPRALLAETVFWWDLVRCRPDVDRFRIGLAAENYSAIETLLLHSFKKDLAGALVAMHVLRHRFHIFPTQKALTILQQQITWVDIDPESGDGKGYMGKSFAQKTAQMKRFADILFDERLQNMDIEPETWGALVRCKSNGGDIMTVKCRDFSVEKRGDLVLNHLSEFVRAVLKRQCSPGVVEEMINDAKRDVGVPGLKTGDLDAWEVA